MGARSSNFRCEWCKWQPVLQLISCPLGTAWVQNYYQGQNQHIRWSDQKEILLNDVMGFETLLSVINSSGSRQWGKVWDVFKMHNSPMYSDVFCCYMLTVTMVFRMWITCRREKFLGRHQVVIALLLVSVLLIWVQCVQRTSGEWSLNWPNCSIFVQKST